MKFLYVLNLVLLSLFASRLYASQTTTDVPEIQFRDHLEQIGETTLNEDEEEFFQNQFSTNFFRPLLEKSPFMNSLFEQYQAHLEMDHAQFLENLYKLLLNIDKDEHMKNISENWEQLSEQSKETLMSKSNDVVPLLQQRKEVILENIQKLKDGRFEELNETYQELFKSVEKDSKELQYLKSVMQSFNQLTIQVKEYFKEKNITFPNGWDLIYSYVSGMASYAQESVLGLASYANGALGSLYGSLATSVPEQVTLPSNLPSLSSLSSYWWGSSTQGNVEENQTDK